MENEEQLATGEQPKNKREIRKIAMSVGGLKGLILNGTIESVEKNKPITNEFSDKIRHPIHRELEDKFSDLRAHLLEICGVVTGTTPKKKVFELREGCDILAIEFELGDSPYFKIKGSSRVLETKFQTLTTPKVEKTDGYEFFDEVMDTIEEILVEVNHYVNKTKVISNEELLVSYIKHGKGVGINMDDYEAMDRDEKQEFLNKKLSELGFIALIQDTQESEEGEFEEEETDGANDVLESEEKEIF